MKSRLGRLVVASGLLALGTVAVADHNSKNGEGWANMPNDIHNTRVETRQSGDNESFREFVRYGAGSKSTNRFDSNSTRTSRGLSSRAGSGRGRR